MCVCACVYVCVQVCVCVCVCVYCTCAVWYKGMHVYTVCAVVVIVL